MEADSACFAGGRETCRRLFDDPLFRAISFLESHHAVTGVSLCDWPGVTQDSLKLWEQENDPYKLPDDYKALLTVTNGTTARWNIRFRSEIIPFGVMHINCLEKVKSLPIGVVSPKLSKVSSAELVQDHGEHRSTVSGGPLRRGTSADMEIAAAFDLDAECSCGRVALLYFKSSLEEVGSYPSSMDPQVWFKDLAGSWHFLAETFTDYFRLVATHLGIPHWQCAFSDMGLDPSTQHWLALFCPDRLEVASHRLTQMKRRVICNQVESLSTPLPRPRSSSVHKGGKERPAGNSALHTRRTRLSSQGSSSRVGAAAATVAAEANRTWPRML